MTKNNKWFTLVELIIVITILAILATIAFLSFQSFSADARDSKRLSNLQSISDQILVKGTIWSRYVDMVWTEVANNKANLKIQWNTAVAIASTDYKVWNLNFQLLGINKEEFTDSHVWKDYVIAWINTWAIQAYQLAATLENASWTPIARVNWNYIPRKSTDSASWTVSADLTKITLDNNFWIFKKWDIITGGWEITNISRDSKVLTVSWATASWALVVKLNNSESDSLIFNWANNVVNGWTVLPY